MTTNRARRVAGQPRVSTVKATPSDNEPVEAVPDNTLALPETLPERLPVPGWYDREPGVQKWWDGSAWTEFARPTPTPEMRAAAAAAAAQPAPVYYPAPAPVPYPMPVGHAVTYSPNRTSHGVHLFMSIITGGLWAFFVWIPITIWNAIKKDQNRTTFYAGPPA